MNQLRRGLRSIPAPEYEYENYFKLHFCNYFYNSFVLCPIYVLFLKEI